MRTFIFLSILFVSLASGCGFQSESPHETKTASASSGLRHFYCQLRPLVGKDPKTGRLVILSPGGVTFVTTCNERLTYPTTRTTLSSVLLCSSSVVSNRQASCLSSGGRWVEGLPPKRK